VPKSDRGMDTRQINDHLGITAVLNRYARADYSSADGAVGGREEVADWLSAAFTHLPMSQHYITNIEITLLTGDSAHVRAMFHCMLREENAWFVNRPATAGAGG
jgi:hypothetical protein